MSFLNASAKLFTQRSTASAALASASTGIGLVASGLLFRDVSDLSQMIVEMDRDTVFRTHRRRHGIAAVSTASLAVGTAAALPFYKTSSLAVKSAWMTANDISLLLLYTGYVNPWLMMRPRNKGALYVPSSEALQYVDEKETVIVTRVNPNEVPKAFPDSQIVRPHVVRAGVSEETGNPIIMTYCGLTNLGIAYETPNHPNGKEYELAPITQLENNLVMVDKSTGHVAQQINGVDETALLNKLPVGCTYNDTKRKLASHDGVLDKNEVWKEVPSWRMTMKNYLRAYPQGEVFINDYKMFKSFNKNPIKYIYDTIADFVFDQVVTTQAIKPEPMFPTIKNIDPRLPAKEKVWGFNVGQNYVALTENFVRDGPNGGVRNINVGGIPLVASWDAESSSLGIWHRRTDDPILTTVNIHGNYKGNPTKEPLSRLATVKNGAFWCVWANFFPQTKVNPEK